MLDQALGLLDHHLGYGNVARGRLIKGGGHDLPLHGPLHVRHLFRAFVDQQNNQIAFGMVHLDRAGDVLQQNRLTRPRRRHDQGPLAFTNRGDKVDDPGGAILDRRILDLHLQPLIGVQRRQVVEGDLMAGLLRRLKVDLADIGQRKVTLILARGLHHAVHRIPGAQGMLADHVRRHVDVIRTRQIVRLRRTQESKTVLHHLQHPITRDLPAILCAFPEDLEHHLALAHGRGVVDLQLLREGDEVLRRLRFQIGEGGFFLGHGACPLPHAHCILAGQRVSGARDAGQKLWIGIRSTGRPMSGT